MARMADGRDSSEYLKQTEYEAMKAAARSRRRHIIASMRSEERTNELAFLAAKTRAEREAEQRRLEQERREAEARRQLQQALESGQSTTVNMQGVVTGIPVRKREAEPEKDLSGSDEKSLEKRFERLFEEESKEVKATEETPDTGISERFKRLDLDPA